MRTAYLLGGAIVALALLWWKRPRATVTTDYEVIGVAPTSSGAAAFAQAIAKAEGFSVPGSIPQTRNNPGNLKLSGSSITTFQTAADGWNALYKQLGLIVNGRSPYYNLSMTIAQMGNVWAPTGDNNVPGAWARNVAAALGVPVSTPLYQVLL